MEKLITFTQDMSEEDKRFAEQFLKARTRELTDVCVIYRPSCGCEVDQFVVLDRFPMSPKIHGTCPLCNRGILMEISDPIQFHVKLNDMDFDLEDLVNSFISDSWQKPLLKKYAELYLNKI